MAFATFMAKQNELKSPPARWQDVLPAGVRRGRKLMQGEPRVNQPTVLVTARNVDPLAIQYLVDHGCTVRHPALNGRDPAPETLPALLADVDG